MDEIIQCAISSAGKDPLPNVSMKIESTAMDTGTAQVNLYHLLDGHARAPTWPGLQVKKSNLLDLSVYDFKYQNPQKHGSLDLTLHGRGGRAGGPGIDIDIDLGSGQ
ncbi:type II secretion system protein GspG [Pseudomonas cannabina]|uniref:type II secretion system protein GspG n=1 Tax=Pseudomonas syringae group TaxID=136849 RepID=UPI0006B8C83F|nr:MULTISPECIES: type II secretion system protein GspG [Pseudomonas syringae group]QQN22625.1 type II secretion system protein GspG [Pseudomonas cannabina pv. alisalensis]